MTENDFEVTINRFPAGEEDEGTVLLLGNSSKRAWLNEMYIPNRMDLTLGYVIRNLNNLTRLGIRSGIESIEVHVIGGEKFIATCDKDGYFRKFEGGENKDVDQE